MADCNDLFQKFLSEISISNTQMDKLKRGRDAIREKIKNYFKNELNVSKQPEFYEQGSYKLRTIVQPLGKKDYDLDDGIYLQHTDDDPSDPKPQTVSKWIIGAVENHTNNKPINKKNCVRIVYEEGYHIDIPAYRNIKGKIHLGTLEGNKWIPSDAKKFNNWFYERLEKTEQMRSCIKYLKAWKDFKDCDLKGIHLTVLVGLKHVESDKRDDMSLFKTVEQIIDYLNDKRAIYNPIDKSENLIEDWTSKKIDSTIEDLTNFYNKAKSALEKDDKKRASQIWQDILGKRFQLHEDNDKNKKNVIVVPAIIDERPKSWGK